jgi:hypothetical protein
MNTETIAPTGLGSQRRLQALAARSWSTAAISEASGITADEVRSALEHPATVSPELASRIAQAYDRLWSAQPPRTTPEQQASADAIGAHARAQGWPPPLGWDEEDLDRAEGRPADGWQRSARSTIRAADLAEDAEFVRGAGGYRQATNGVVAMRLGVTRAALEKALERSRSRQPAAEMEAAG